MKSPGDLLYVKIIQLYCTELDLYYPVLQQSKKPL